MRYADVAETHSAAVFFFGDRAYKIKKPLDLGFLDFRGHAEREAICQREVAMTGARELELEGEVDHTGRRLGPQVEAGVPGEGGADRTEPDPGAVRRLDLC